MEHLTISCKTPRAKSGLEMIPKYGNINETAHSLANQIQNILKIEINRRNITQ